MQRLVELYKLHYGNSPANIEAITGSGSSRQYFRLTANGQSAIGVIGTSIEENNAFIGLTNHFLNKNLPVPTIYDISSDRMAYLQSDLGKDSLYSLLSESRRTGNYSKHDICLLEKTVAELPRIQFIGAEGLDTSLCYPTHVMDSQSIHFDLNYFKYCFLKLIPEIEFNEISLENDFNKIVTDIERLCSDEGNIILRDCQARNVIMTDSMITPTPHFIDYQGCRFGPKEYDLASFLWQSSANYPQSLREYLINVYIDALLQLRPNINSQSQIRQNLNLMVLFRLLQVLGAYGFRGYIQHKPYFVNSIPFAINNLKDIIRTGIADSYPYLKSILEEIILIKGIKQNPMTTQKENTPKEVPLTVTVWSFSYRKGIPDDESGNGGGYVFDCRSTHNPGKYEQYKHLTGLDQPVISFLEEDGEILSFLKHVYPLVSHHTQRFIERGFSNLTICFGCTGGQHRSVYSAQHVAEYLRHEFPNVKVHLIHREQHIDNFL